MVATWPWANERNFPSNIPKMVTCLPAMHANTVFNVDRGATGRISHGKKPGPDPYLTTDEEAKLCDFLIETSDYGYRRTKREVKKLYTIPAN